MLAPEIEASTLYTDAQARIQCAGYVLANGNVDHAIRVAIAVIRQFSTVAKA